jgi:hypothetical protein
VDGRFDEVVLRALEREPERRYQEVSELKAALEGLVPETPPGQHAGPEVKHGEPGLSGARRGGTTAPYLEEGRAKRASDPIRRKVAKPAIGLMATVLVSLLELFLLIPQLHLSSDASVLLFLSLSLILLVCLVVTITGAMAMRFLDSYQWAVVGSSAAMVPLAAYGLVFAWGALSDQNDFGSLTLALLPATLGWVFSGGMGVWAALILSQSEVKAAFTAERQRKAEKQKEQERRRAVGSSKRRAYSTTPTGWAILCTLFGLMATVLPVFPWVVVDVGISGGPGVLQYRTVEVYGYHSGFGITLAVVFLGLLVLLIVTGFIEPIPMWQPLAMMLAGIAVLGITGVYLVNLSALAHRSTELLAPFKSVPGKVDYVRVQPTPYAVGTLGLVLLLLGAVQLRGVLMRWRNPAA